MIVLDTQTWVWWVQEPQKLSRPQLAAIISHEHDVIGVSAISCWEIAKLVEIGRRPITAGLREWFEVALGFPCVTLLPLTQRWRLRRPLCLTDFTETRRIRSSSLLLGSMIAR